MPPPLTDSEESDDNGDDPSLTKPTVEPAAASYLTTETELNCNHCTYHMEPPIQMHDSEMFIVECLERC